MAKLYKYKNMEKHIFAVNKKKNLYTFAKDITFIFSIILFLKVNNNYYYKYNKLQIIWNMNERQVSKSYATVKILKTKPKKKLANC